MEKKQPKEVEDFLLVSEFSSMYFLYFCYSPSRKLSKGKYQIRSFSFLPETAHDAQS